MEDAVAEEVTPSHPAEGAQLQSKENDYSLKPENSNTLECQEMRIPGEGDYSMRIPVEGDYSQGSHQEFFGMLDGKSVDRSISHVNELEHPYNSLGFMDDGGFMVEELTVRNYNNSKLAIQDASNNQGRLQTRQNQWQHLYQLASGSGSGSSRVNTAFRDNGQVMPSGLENVGYTSLPEHLAQSDNHYEVVEELTKTENRVVSGNTYAGIRTKILSKSGFSEFFVKNTLKGKGIIFKGPHHDGCHVESRNLNSTKVASGSMVAADPTPSLDANIAIPSYNGVNAEPRLGGCHVESRNLNSTKVASGSMVAADPTQSLDANIGMPSSNGVNAEPRLGGCHVESRNLNSTKVASGSMVAADLTPSLDANIGMPSSNRVNAEPRLGGSDNDEISLREWLKIGHPKVNKVECLCVFRQIVDLVDHFHSQGVALHGLQPTFFKLLPSNQVKYVGLPVQKEMLESIMDQDTSQSENSSIRKKPVEQEFSSVGVCSKKQKTSQNTRLFRQCPQFPSTSSFKRETVNTSHINGTGLRNGSNVFGEPNPGTKLGTHTKSRSPLVYNAAQQQLTSISEQLEEKWYISPEELSEGSCTVSSNIYSLGVLLFELLAHFDSNSALAAAMSNLRHRILPPNFLSENAKEAGFCLWLLHPEPSSRPTTREILQSEVVNGLQEVCVKELSSFVDQEDEELELLLHFLTSLKEQRQKDASKLMETIQFLESDVEEVERRHRSRKPLIDPGLYDESLNGRKNDFFNKEASRSEVLSPLPPVPSSYESRLVSNIDQLESAYFSMRSRIQLPETDSTICIDKDLLRSRKNSYLTTKDEETKTPTDRLGAIFDGLCKYARYSKFKVRGVLRSGDFNSSSNVICSLSFDRDEDYFAAAGVSKKIKIFEFNALFNDSVDIHYPVVEMPNKSKISCVCWNNYIKNYVASTDYDGVVKLWDVSTGQEFAQYTEHERRAWSVDFSQVHPTKLASGSDDGTVKLWSINEKNCLGTIKNIANVCCVQFSTHSTHLLAFGSADFRTYCYDLRNAKMPWCVLAGHEKAVSYVKFLDSETLVSASTDNTLKLWDLNKSSLSGPSINACSLTLAGHTNEKNFVGLSVSDGYIACGSETNEVYAYHRSLPMPITSHKFGSIDPISGKETDDDNGQFVSSVCWRGKSDMVVAANSSGCIKVLQIA